MATQTGATNGEGPAPDDELAQAWKLVEEKVVQMAGGDRSKINKNLGIDGVLSYLDRVQENDRKVADKYSTARDIFNKTLQCISNVGGIVSDGASNVFAPAGMCYNALTFVIQAWQGYEGIFDSIAALLEKCSEFFDRLVEYEEIGMNKKLSRVACQFLDLFVRVCDRAIQLKKKRSKLAAFMKQLFLNDDGMQDLLSQMKKLAEKEHGLVSAQTWNKSNEAAALSRDNLVLAKKADTQLGSLVDGQSQEKKEKEKVKWRRIVAKALEFDPSAVSTEKTEPWEEAFNRHKKALLVGSGEWLAKEPLFDAWVKVTDSSKPILGLEGGDGAGKTTMTANIIARLKRLKGVDGTSVRSTVAYYFIEKDSKATIDSREVGSIATRSLLWQLATSDDPYMKSIVSLCEKAGSFTSTEEMWAQLLLDNEDRNSMDSAFFIVVDGLDENVASLLHLLGRVSEPAIGRRTRVLLTGPKTMFDVLDNANVGFDKITLGEPNKPDIGIFVNARMDDMDMLKDPKRPGISEMRSKIQSSLTDMTGGDYYKIGRVLDDIGKTDEVEEIERLLETAGLTRPDQIEADIEKLNKTRTVKEIAEINEIIVWINDGREWLKPKQMEAALTLRAGRGTNGIQTSLMSVESKIQTKYSIFTVDSFNEIDYKVGGIKEKIPNKKRRDVDVESSSGFKEIQPAEINIVKHYLSTVCPPDVYEKFGFEEFFKLKMVRKGNYICQDPDNSHMTLALRCMMCLVEQRTDKTESLLPYSINNLLFHLNEADLSLADRELKSEVGSLFVRLFTEDYAISSLFWGDRTDPDDQWLAVTVSNLINTNRTTPYSWCDWFVCDVGLSIATKLFKDSAVSEKVATEPLVTKFKENPDGGYLVLFDQVAKRAARRIFREQGTKSDLVYNFILLQGILKRANSKKPDEATASSILGELLDFDVAMIETVEDWSQKALEVAEKDSIWETRKATLLLRLVETSDKVTREQVAVQARKAIALDAESYRASYILAHVLESREESIALLSGLVDKLRGDTEWQAKEGNSALLAAMMLELGDKYWISEEQTDLAIALYTEALDFDQSRPTLRWYIDVLKEYDKRKQWGAQVRFLDRLLQVPDDDEKTVGYFLLRATWSSNFAEFSDRFVRALKAENRWDLADAVYQRASLSTTDYWWLYCAQFQYGQVIMARNGQEEAAIKIWETALTQPTNASNEYLRTWVMDGISRELVPAYLKLARDRAAETEVVQGYYAKIETLYKEWEAGERRSKMTSITYARYCHTRGDTLRARKILKNFMIEDLEMLSDDDIENDYTSYWDLGLVFSIMEDMPNALVAWEMMAQSRQAMLAAYVEKKAAWDKRVALGRKTEDTADQIIAEEPKDAEKSSGADAEGEPKDDDKGATETPEQKEKSGDDTGTSKEGVEEAEPEKPDLAIASCDGCGYAWNFASEMWTCSETGSAQLDDACYRKFQDGTLTLPLDLCSKDHKFYYIGKRDETKYSLVPKGYVLFGDDSVKWDDWKNGFKASYVDFDEPPATE